MQNNSYEEKKHFNVIDVLIIIGAILIIVGIIFRAQLISIFNANATETKYSISFEAEAVDNNVAELLQNGNNVTWLDKSQKLGAITTVEKSPTKIFVPENETGKYIAVDSDKTQKVTGTISALGNSKNGCYINGTTYLAAGMTVVLATENAEFTAIITSVTAV
jgi:hypothetical protein